MKTDATRLLDHYRISVASDPDAVRILSILYRDGPKREDELCETTQIKLGQLRAKIRELYQASLLQPNDEKYVDLTDYGRFVMAGLGVAEVAAKSFIWDFGVPDYLKTFLEAWIEAKCGTDPNWALQYTHRLKCVKLADRVVDGPRISQSTRMRALLLVVIGLDPDAYYSACEDSIDGVIQWHRSRSSDLWQTKGKFLELHRDAFSRQFKRALRDAEFSDRVLTDENPPSKKGQPEVALLANITRALRVLLFGEADVRLRHACWVEESAPDRLCMNLDRATHDLRASWENILGRYRRDIEPEGWNDKWMHVRICDILRDAVADSGMSEGFVSITSRLQRKGTIGSTWDSHISEINKLKIGIEAGVYDHLAITNKTNLCNEVDALQKVIHKWLGSGKVHREE